MKIKSSIELDLSFPMWAVSISQPPSVDAMFSSHQQADRFADEMKQRYTHVRVFEIQGEEET